jgi:hypothetical protein
MVARVYECDKSEAEALKKVLEYDPYLDPKLVPASKSDKDLKLMSEEDQKRYHEEEAKSKEAIKKLHEDKYANVIFARQGYSFRDGATLNLDGNKSYLYLDSSEQFLGLAEERFKKEFKTVKRAGKSEEEKVISTIKSEEDKAAAGFGSIFGS